jgi:ABC-type ATPase involved in cell division
MFQAGRAAGERVFDILDAPVEVGERKAATDLPNRVRGEVEYRAVGFEYRSDLPVLHEINLRAEPGETIALVGPTGAGKSTIVNLLPRFYDATRGSIMIDGHDIRDVTLESLRRQIGVVSQEAFLFNGTIRENILYGRLDAREQEMIAAAEAANCHEFITRLPEGYDSRVGERGVKLSVGEKQRVSIARAVEGPAHFDFGRGDGQRGHGDGKTDPTGAGEVDGASHELRHRASVVNGAQRGPDSGVESGRHHRARHTRGIDGAGRVVRAPLPGAVHGGHHRGTAGRDERLNQLRFSSAAWTCRRLLTPDLIHKQRVAHAGNGLV